MTLTDLPEVQALSAEEKLQLAEELWLAAAPELARADVSAPEKEILDQRWASFLENPSSALTIEQFKSNLKPLRS